MKNAEYGLTEDLIFRSAVEFLKKKQPLQAEEYKMLSDECKAKAFTVSSFCICCQLYCLPYFLSLFSQTVLYRRYLTKK